MLPFSSLEREKVIRKASPDQKNQLLRALFNLVDIQEKLMDIMKWEEEVRRMSLIDQIRAMSPEEKKALAAALKDLEPKPEPEHVSLGKSPDFRPKDEHGRPLTAEEIYDREHPLQLMRKPYGYYESFQDITGKKTCKVWTRAEVDAFNKPIEEAWLAEKKKHFPNAILPANTGVSPESRFADPRYTHPMVGDQ